MVGLSPKPHRPSHGVSQYMQSQGYQILPVNPGHDRILGEQTYPSLTSIPVEFETVNIFRNPKYVMPIVEEAIKSPATYLWMQEGVVNEQAGQKARDAGMIVVMNRCILKEHRRLM